MAPSNVLPIHGNEKTMNLNTLVLTNIQSSPYFKVHLYELKTYHQVIDEIYYKVNHLEPWEKGSRKTAGQTGMCGGVRGVGAGGIVSSAYCLLYKLYTLKLTRKQLIGLCTHADSPYIRALGLMYIRYTQPPGDLWDWYEPYLDDEEQVDVKAGGGNMMTIGEISQQYLTKLEWYCTLFPRIPVPIQKQIEAHLNGHRAKNWNKAPPQQHVDDEPEKPEPRNDGDNLFGEAERVSRRETSRERRPVAPSSRRPDPHERDRLDQERSRPREDRHSYGDVKRESHGDAKRDSHSDVKRDSHGDAKRDSHRRSRSPRGRRSVSRDRHHSRSGDHIRRSHDRSRHRSRDRSPARTHHRRSKDRKRSSSRSRRRSRSNDDRKRSDDGARHSSKTIDGAKRHCSSRHRSASPNHHHASSGDAFDRDLQKELERVKAAKDTENGRK